jgi:hypothetical protein
MHFNTITLLNVIAYRTFSVSLVRGNDRGYNYRPNEITLYLDTDYPTSETAVTRLARVCCIVELKSPRNVARDRIRIGHEVYFLFVHRLKNHKLLA